MINTYEDYIYFIFKYIKLEILKNSLIGLSTFLIFIYLAFFSQLLASQSLSTPTFDRMLPLIGWNDQQLRITLNSKDSQFHIVPGDMSSQRYSRVFKYKDWRGTNWCVKYENGKLIYSTEEDFNSRFESRTGLIEFIHWDGTKYRANFRPSENDFKIQAFKVYANPMLPEPSSLERKNPKPPSSNPGVNALNTRAINGGFYDQCSSGYGNKWYLKNDDKRNSYRVTLQKKMTAFGDNSVSTITKTVQAGGKVSLGCSKDGTNSKVYKIEYKVIRERKL